LLILLAKPTCLGETAKRRRKLSEGWSDKNISRRGAPVPSAGATGQAGQAGQAEMPRKTIKTLRLGALAGKNNV